MTPRAPLAEPGGRSEVERLSLPIHGVEVLVQARIFPPERRQHGVAASAGPGVQVLGADLETADDRRGRRYRDAGDVRRTGLLVVPAEDLLTGRLVAVIPSKVGRGQGR